MQVHRSCMGFSPYFSNLGSKVTLEVKSYIKVTCCYVVKITKISVSFAGPVKLTRYNVSGSQVTIMTELLNISPSCILFIGENT